jgi:hypothetical protein
LVRQATTLLSRATTLDQICEILSGAFSENEFDGFEFRVESRKTVPTHTSNFLMANHAGHLLYSWRKSLSADPLEESPATWSLQLGLASPDGREWGSLSLYRLYREESLLLDIDLLISAFRNELTASVHRICTTPHASSEQEAKTALRMSAKAAGHE